MYLPPLEFWTNEQVAEWIKSRIETRTPEDGTCDYKANFDFSPKGKKELVKDVTGFANSSGGIIIVGISEDAENSHLPNKDSEGLPKNPGELLRVEQILLAQTAPMLPALEIREIPWAKDGTKVIYIIYHPRSWSRPHRNECDGRFYKRQSESTLEMSEEEISFQYTERRATQIYISTYLKNADYGLNMVAGEQRVSVAFVPLPVRESIINFYSERGREFLKDTVFVHGRYGEPWVPCKDGVISRYGEVPGTFAAKILPSGALLYSATAKHIVSSTKEISIDNVVDIMMDKGLIDFAQKLYTELSGVTQIHLRVEVIGMSGIKLIAVGNRILSAWQIDQHPEYSSGDICIDLQVTSKAILSNPDSIQEVIRDRLANLIGLWEFPKNT